MSNCSFEANLLKLGKSSRDPDSFRKKELQTTGVPGEFTVEYSAFVNNFDDYEKSIHKLFERDRYSVNREFFSLDLEECCLRIRLLLANDLIFEEINPKLDINRRRTVVDYYECGQKMVIRTVRNGKLWGEYKEFFKDGSLKVRTNYADNEENGRRKEFNKNGELRSTGLMFKGMKQGRWITMTALGEETRFYDSGSPVGTWNVFKKGRLITDYYGDFPQDYETKKYTGIESLKSKGAE